MTRRLGYLEQIRHVGGLFDDPKDTYDQPHAFRPGQVGIGQIALKACTLEGCGRGPTHPVHKVPSDINPNVASTEYVKAVFEHSQEVENAREAVREGSRAQRRQDKINAEATKAAAGDQSDFGDAELARQCAEPGLPGISYTQGLTEHGGASLAAAIASFERNWRHGIPKGEPDPDAAYRMQMNPRIRIFLTTPEVTPEARASIEQIREAIVALVTVKLGPVHVLERGLPVRRANTCEVELDVGRALTPPGLPDGWIIREDGFDGYDLIQPPDVDPQAFHKLMIQSHRFHGEHGVEDATRAAQQFVAGTWVPDLLSPIARAEAGKAKAARRTRKPVQTHDHPCVGCHQLVACSSIARAGSEVYQREHKGYRPICDKCSGKERAAAKEQRRKELAPKGEPHAYEPGFVQAKRRCARCGGTLKAHETKEGVKQTSQAHNTTNSPSDTPVIVLRETSLTNPTNGAEAPCSNSSSSPPLEPLVGSSATSTDASPDTDDPPPGPFPSSSPSTTEGSSASSTSAVTDVLDAIPEQHRAWPPQVGEPIAYVASSTVTGHGIVIGTTSSVGPGYVQIRPDHETAILHVHRTRLKRIEPEPEPAPEPEPEPVITGGRGNLTDGELLGKDDKGRDWKVFRSDTTGKYGLCYLAEDGTWHAEQFAKSYATRAEAVTRFEVRWEKIPDPYETDPAPELDQTPAPEPSTELAPAGGFEF